MIEIKDVRRLLKGTKKIIDHHEELTIAKGEHFNLFSVLNIETKENKTHSAFLAELLNPKGSHKMGDVFLRLFIDVIDHNENHEIKTSEKSNFKTDKASVKVEYTIPGKIKLYNKEGEDKSKATGGRIDIYLKDSLGNRISIENKIHASDQEAQIQRYCNHEPEKNTVYYLTLKGEDPDKSSSINLKSNKDFFNISYRTTIINWLELCLKEVSNFTSLREAINQYIVLIKKLTNTMNSKHDKELLDLMMANIEESSFIATNYDKALNRLKQNFRKNIIEVLKQKLNPDFYNIEEGNSIEKKNSQIWIHFKSKPQPYFLFGVESFSGSGFQNGNLFVGLINMHNSSIISKLPDENKLNYGWRQVRFLKTKDLNHINLSHKYTIKILNNKTSTSYENLLNRCCDQIVCFVEDYEKKLPKEVFINNLTENDI
ncbi:PD-(D/E)XK nuclease family protein [uncultured Dokdonia sp.]|uniref:PDDEXK-like family protein n=1 Tax=uncultured Dokdonia sp. TaxID=575653 RepID=UPI0026398C28|nr:PD-(D/E)XK nuclease family protein [uncultured Dokdonia sp.]